MCCACATLLSAAITAAEAYWRHLRGDRLGLIDNWLRHVQDVRDKYRHALELVATKQATPALCELNVVEQVVNVARTTIAATPGSAART